MLFGGVDWGYIFTPDVPLLESFIRGTVFYVLVFVIMRGTLRRTAGQLTMLDFVFVLLVASGAANAMSGESVAIPNGIVIIVTIVGWNYLFNTLTWYVPMFERLMTPQPLKVIHNGELVVRNMRREFITRDELYTKLREEGIEDASEVREAYIEGDGNMSIIRYDREDTGHHSSPLSRS